PPSYLTMDQAIAAGSDANYRHRLYRGWVEAARGDVHLRFGRQRIAWGTGKLWNPTDVLNPFVPTTVERDERAGVDALYARTGLGELGQAESAWTLARDWAGSDLLGRLRGNRAGTDFSAMGGKVAGSTGSWMAGGDFASDLAGGSLHGEAAYVDPRTAPPYWRALAGYETTLSAAAPEPFKDLWALAEVYRNGQGSVHPARYDFSALLTGRTISLGKDYAGAGLRKDLHPLVQLEIYQLVNLDDGSAFFAPALDWNALANLHLSGGWQRFSGGRGTEYGRLANLAFLQAQYFF
ncbi:MAG TPA: hypothetical protein VNI01_06515, partial [Elusimicrobiota bacterium]|nr:hypothetical protein [Elusimicrobiota bacterium]